VIYAFSAPLRELFPSISMRANPQGISCDGWWQQVSYGRQPMRDLYLAFSAGQIDGSGHDLVGPFTLLGTLDPAGRVEMKKQYLGLWSVDYIGTYDGEGLLFGHWQIGVLTDQWLIRLKPSRAVDSADTAVQALDP
jgi:hypothetical protein